MPSARASLCCAPERRRPPPPRPRAASGWSLIELLVAAALSLSLAALALRAYLAGDLMQRDVTAELRLHEGARYAFHALGNSIRLAGFPGCLGESNEFSPFASTWRGPPAFAPVEGWNAQRPHPEFGAGQEGEVIALWWSVAGCGDAAPRELRPPPGGGGGLRGSLFYIGRRGNDAGNPPALFLRELSSLGDATGPARELVEGLEAIRFSYQTSASGNPLPAQQVADWRDVRGIRVELRLRSTLDADLSRDFSQMLALRNRPLAAADFPQVEWPPEDPQGPQGPQNLEAPPP
ncbi:MAG: hypothetical protein OXE54_02440 [Gammaproteobacteria bacterium]|nr:hypothetical protein [Gammaproteobacteria bacterium]